MATWQLNTFYEFNFFIPSLQERISSVFFFTDIYSLVQLFQRTPKIKN